MQDNWPSVKAQIEKILGSAKFQTYFSRVELLGVGEGEKKIATLGAPNIFIIRNIKKYQDVVKEAFLKTSVVVDEIECVVADVKNTNQKAHEVTGSERSTAARVIKQMPTRHTSYNTNNASNLNPRYRMDNFVVGSNNDLAAGVAKAVIDNPGKAYNPFYLYSGSGLGKTHLINAIGNAMLEKNPELKILYLPVHNFYSDFVAALKQNKGQEFAQKFLKLDVLIIDDIQMIVGKEKSQEEFFNIFNELYQKNKQIIIASDRLPNQIKEVDPRLTSRMSSGGAFDIQMPSLEDKCAILRAKAEYEGKEIENEAIEYIAENVKTNIRDLESEYARVMAMSELKGISPMELISGGYRGMSYSANSRIISPRQIVEKTAKVFQIDAKELKSRSRLANIKTARQVAMYLLSKELHMSTTKIANEVGVKDHTTVMHGVNKIAEDLKLKFELRDQIDEIRRALYG